MWYSDEWNKFGIRAGSLSERLYGVDLNTNYLHKGIEELKKEKDFVIFGTGDRSRSLANVLYEKYHLLPKAVLVNKKYYKEGMEISLSKEIKVPVLEFEKYVKEQKHVTMVLGVPKGIVEKEILVNSKIHLISFNFSLSAEKDGYCLPKDYWENNKEKLEFTYRLLQDRYSQEAYYENLVSRITGKDIIFPKAPWSAPIYFLEDLMIWKKQECLVDGGAYIGDTISEFLNKMPADKVENYKIYSFEPDEKNYNRLQKEFKENKNILPIKKGIFSDRGGYFFTLEMVLKVS